MHKIVKFLNAAALLVACVGFTLGSPSKANANTLNFFGHTDGNNDVLFGFFSVASPTTIMVDTPSGDDPMLFPFNASNSLVAFNDDFFSLIRKILRYKV